MSLSKWQALRSRGDNDSNRMDGRRMGFGEYPSIPGGIIGHPDNDGSERYYEEKRTREGRVHPEEMNYHTGMRYDREMNYPAGMRRRMEMNDGYEPPSNRQRYRRYENGRFRPARNTWEPPYGGEDEEDDYGGREKPIHAGGTFWMEKGGRHGEEAVQPLTMEQARMWVQNMTPPDPNNRNTGGKLSYEEVKAMANKHGINNEEKVTELYAVANAMKSDYVRVAQKYGIGDPMFYFDMAKAFINDEDAKLHKTALYYKYIAAK